VQIYQRDLPTEQYLGTWERASTSVMWRLLRTPTIPTWLQARTVNCNIPGDATNDIHIVLLKDPNDDECLSTTAEMSPHYRPPDWTDKNLLKASAGHPVRVKGHLFFDGSHTPCSGNSRPNPKRASLWEIHPVYSVDVCTQTTITECQSSTAEWIPLSKLFSSEEQ
jgi:hypothetical protein